MIEGWSTWHDNAPANVLVEVDGKSIDEVPVEGTENEPGVTKIPLRLKQGTRKIELTYTNDAYTEGVNGKPPIDRNLFVSAVAVHGRKKPPKVDAESLPKSHRLIVTPSHRSLYHPKMQPRNPWAP